MAQRLNDMILFSKTQLGTTGMVRNAFWKEKQDIYCFRSHQDSPSPPMAVLGARFVGNPHRLHSAEDRFLNHGRVFLPVIKLSARPGTISGCIGSGAGKISTKASARAVSASTMEQWIRESVGAIVQDLRGSASLVAEVYTEGNGGRFRLKIEKAGAEEWAEILEKWNKGETPSPDGIIVVRELEEEGEEKKEERMWGLMVQGKGMECAPRCYILKTSRAKANSEVPCSHFVLIKVGDFNESAKSQVNQAFLVDGDGGGTVDQ